MLTRIVRALKACKPRGHSRRSLHHPADRGGFSGYVLPGCRFGLALHSVLQLGLHGQLLRGTLCVERKEAWGNNRSVMLFTLPVV